MKITSFQVDAFTDRLFGGNPAAVVLLPEYPGDDLLKSIASENNLPETAFVVPDGQYFRLRWFTPDIEMDLCGHATLASAHIIFSQTGYMRDTIKFRTVSGELIVKRCSEGYEMEFPLREGLKSELPKEIFDALSIKPKEVYKSRDYLLIYDKQEDVERIIIDRNILDTINLGEGGVIVSAPGRNCDFVSRFFTPQATLLEDPVTGSAHCTSAPYWSKRLGKSELTAKQISKRLGTLTCQVCTDKVVLRGGAILYSRSELMITF